MQSALVLIYIGRGDVPFTSQIYKRVLRTYLNLLGIHRLDVYLPILDVNKVMSSAHTCTPAQLFIFVNPLAFALLAGSTSFFFFETNWLSLFKSSATVKIS